MKLKEICLDQNLDRDMKKPEWSRKERFEYLDILFDRDEGVTFGNAWTTNVINKIHLDGDDEDYEFISINPLDKTTDHMWIKDESRYSKDKPRRCDWNITCFRNFMFEMDDTPLEQQRQILETCGIPWSAVVYSGGKSYHAILSIDGGLPDAPIASIPGLDKYKYTWKRLAARIDGHASILFGEKEEGYVDKSSKNPSRFSRFPNSIRPDKSRMQSVCYIGERITQDNFLKLLDNCPLVADPTNTIFNTPQDLTTSEEVFFSLCEGSGLKTKILKVNWGASAGMYFEIYRLTLWAIDATNIDKQTFLDILWKYTFPKLVNYYNYPAEKCEIGVEHAYNMKFPGVYNGRG